MCSRGELWPRLCRSLPQALRGRPLLALLLCLMLGILSAFYLWPQVTSPAKTLTLVCTVLVLLSLGLCVLTRFRRWQALLGLGLGLGFLLCCAQLASLAAWPLAAGDYAIVEGRVRGAPLAYEDGSYRLRLQVARVEGESVRCAPVYVYGLGRPPRPGSLIRVDGRCQGGAAAGNPYAFDYMAHLGREGVAGQLSTVYYGSLTLVEPGPLLSPAAFSQWLRDSFCQALAGLSPPQRALVKGVFLGEKSGLDTATRTSMSLAGLMHIFAVSGLHVGYVVLLALLLAGSGYKRRWLRLGLSLGLLLLYIGLTGGAASILRAGLMALTLLLAELLMERNDPITTLALAALICLAFRPLWLFSAGFQMSFAAVWGLYVLGPLLCRLLRLPARGLGAAWAFSLGATVAVTPLLAYYYYTVSWLGWLLAPPAVAAAGLAVLLCLLSLPFCLLWPPGAAFILQGAAWVMQALSAVADWVADVPGFGSFLGAPSLLSLLLLYGLLLALPVLYRRRGPRPVLLLLPLGLAAFLLAAGPGWRSNSAALPQTLVTATFLDVGQGDCTLLRTADGYSVLLDGGGSRLAPGGVGENVLLPYLKAQGLTAIDLLISSHPDADHGDGLLTVLQYLPVREFMYADFFPEEELQAALVQAARDQGTVLTPAAAGSVYQLGEYLRLSVYSPQLGQVYSEDNEASLVLELSCGQVDMLFTGDAPGSLLAQVTEGRQGEAEIVKLPHHGSKSGYDEDFYRQCEAEAVIISCGRQNSYGHPHPSVVEYWQGRAEIFRTDTQGAVTLYTDGHAWAASTYKQETEE